MGTAPLAIGIMLTFSVACVCVCMTSTSTIPWKGLKWRGHGVSAPRIHTFTQMGLWTFMPADYSNNRKGKSFWLLSWLAGNIKSVYDDTVCVPHCACRPCCCVCACVCWNINKCVLRLYYLWWRIFSWMSVAEHSWCETLAIYIEGEGVELLSSTYPFLVFVYHRNLKYHNDTHFIKSNQSIVITNYFILPNSFQKCKQIAIQ